MRQRQSHSDALRSNTPPALSQVPEGQQQPIIDARVMGDRQGNRQRVRTPGGAAEQLHAELRPRRYACHQTLVEHGQGPTVALRLLDRNGKPLALGVAVAEQSGKVFADLNLAPLAEGDYVIDRVDPDVLGALRKQSG